MAIAFIGKPNVGKSSLFNRLVGRRRSLVWNRPGVTRDRVVETWNLEHFSELSFEVWDMAGWGHADSLGNLPVEWRSQIDFIVFVVDGSEEPSALDRDCLQQVRKLNIPFCVLANKSDKKSFSDNRHLYQEFVGREPLEISAETKEGLRDFEEFIAEQSKSFNRKQHKKVEYDRRILVLGRPNAGKSSLINRLAGTKISYVSETPGTTRDVVEVLKKIGGTKFLFVDSAGVRKKSRIYKKEDPVEIFSASKALAELERADLCILLMEPHARAKIQTQDKKLLKLVRESGVPCVVGVNKWDSIRDQWKEGAYKRQMALDMGEMSYLPIRCVSAKTGLNVKRLLDAVLELDSKIRKYPTSQLNKWLQEVQQIKAPRIAKKGIKAAKIRTATQYLKYSYMVQIKERPMEFSIFCNAPHLIPKDEGKRLHNEIRKAFELDGIPIKIHFRRKNAPRAFKKTGSRA